MVQRHRQRITER